MNGPNNAIGWCHYTWNPVTGCLHGCVFGPNETPCYARRIAERFYGHFRPTFHAERLWEPKKVKLPARIFVSSMGDLFGEWVPEIWIEAVLEVVRECDWHTFQFLTKNPKRLRTIGPIGGFPYGFPENAWVGTSVSGLEDDFDDRVFDVQDFDATVHFLSVEPMLGPVMPRNERQFGGIDWIIMGGATGPGAVKPKREWVDELTDWAIAAGVPVFHKKNLGLVLSEYRQEFPDA